MPSVYSVNDYPVRPARARDLAMLAPLTEGAVRAGEGFVQVAGDPPIGFAQARLHEGHAHVEQVRVQGERDVREIGTALIQALCTQAAVRGQGAITVMAGTEPLHGEPDYGRLDFEVVPAEQPRTGHQIDMARAEEERGGSRVLMRRVLRRHRTVEELRSLLPVLDAMPRDEGTLGLLVRRPAEGEREVLVEGELDVQLGLVGDTWAERRSSRTADGSPHPEMQLNVMSHPLVAFLAQDPDREPLAGDQLYVDLDLSGDNLPTGTQLRIGDPNSRGAVIEVTAQPHTGCGKFIDRFGVDAMRFVNGPQGRPRRLRGLCARVVVPGRIRPGDPIVVNRP